MASYSSIANEVKNNNRSDPSRMNNIDQTRLARLRPEKLDDVAINEQILLIQKACEDVDPEIIALVFHECDYNMQRTINRIQTGDFEDGGWQTAKSNNKKKTHNNNNQNDQILNGVTLSDSERALSQRASPTSSLRDGRRRNDHYQYPSSVRTDARRYGNDSGRNHFNPTNSRYSARTNSNNKSVPSSKTNTTSSQPIPSETSLPSKQSNEEIPQISFPSIDEYEFVDGPTQSLNFDNSQEKTSLQSSSKRRIPSSIPHEPVSMHSTVQFPSEPIDIQFGDVQWNDSVPTAVSSFNNTAVSTVLDNHEQELLSIANTHNHELNQDVQDTLSSIYINHHTTNETDNQLLETTNQLSSSLSIIDNTISNNLPVVSPEGTSHLSDHLTDTSSSIPTQYSSQQQVPIQIPITRLPPTSTPRVPEYTTSPTSQFIPNNLQQSNNTSTSSAFTPFNFNTLSNYPSAPREYSQTTPWNPQSSNYKTASKATMIPTGTYQQQPSYQLPPQQQQQIFVGHYPYPTLSPAVVQVFAPIDHWPSTGYSTSLESYPYPTANYIPTYSNQQQYHPPTKYDLHSYDKEFFAHYGQIRSSNNDISYQQQQQQQQSSTPSQPTKDPHITSKLSPTAATFSQGVPLTASPSATALYLNPVTFSVPSYYPTMGGTTHQDRTLSYSSVDNRDNRNGASYSGTNNRNNYYHHGQQQQQQQRTHNNNVSNSTWHSQH